MEAGQAPWLLLLGSALAGGEGRVKRDVVANHGSRGGRRGASAD